MTSDFFISPSEDQPYT